MTTANIKGGYAKSIVITRNHASNSLTMLKQAFLKSTEKYVVQVQNFYTSAASRINTYGGTLLAIRRLGLGGLGTPAFPDYYRQGDYQFSGRFHSVSDFIFRLQQFFHRFGFLFQKLSIPALIGVNATALPAGQQNTANLNFYKNFQAPDAGAAHGTSNVGWSQSPDNANICAVGVNSDNELEFVLKPIFLDNFYIEVSPGLQEVFGMNPQLFSFFDGFDTYSDVQQADNLLFVAGTEAFIDDVENRQITVGDGIIRMSPFTVDQLDTRLSIDVVCTFPNSTKITCFNGKESHEYVLARFVIADYKSFRTNTLSNDDGILGTRSITETMTIGLEDMTRGNPDTESNFLLPGSIQQFHISLFTRYFEGGKIITKPTDLDDGFWSLKLLFSKKV